MSESKLARMEGPGPLQIFPGISKFLGELSKLSFLLKLYSNTSSNPIPGRALLPRDKTGWRTTLLWGTWLRRRRGSKLLAGDNFIPPG